MELVIGKNLVRPVLARLRGELAVTKEVSRLVVTLAESKAGLASLASS